MSLFVLNSQTEDKESVRYRVISDFIARRVTRKRAAEILQISERTVARLARKVETKGKDGLKHGNLGKESHRKRPDYVRLYVLNLLQQNYNNLNLRHFSEVLEQEHGITIPYQTLWNWCRAQRIQWNRSRRRQPDKAPEQTP